MQVLGFRWPIRFAPERERYPEKADRGDRGYERRRQLRNCFSDDDRLALDDVSFSVQRQEVLGLIGPNGAGKTTLFECLAALIPANSGTITFHEKPLAVTRRKEALFYLPDGILPRAEQTVSWALQFFEKVYRTSKTKLSELIEPLRLDEIMKARLATLSKGERKRMLLALGLLTPHQALLLDEPFDGLDLRHTRDVMTLLEDHTANGRTLMLSIHQLASVGGMIFQQGHHVARLSEIKTIKRLVKQ